MRLLARIARAQFPPSVDNVGALKLNSQELLVLAKKELTGAGFKHASNCFFINPTLLLAQDLLRLLQSADDFLNDVGTSDTEEDDAFDTDDVCFEGGRDNQVFTFNCCLNRANSHL